MTTDRAPEKAAVALAERRFYSEVDGGTFDDLEVRARMERIAEAHTDLTAALPAIRSQIDQEWEERLKEVKEEFGEKGCVECERRRGEAEERLKEVERQRDDSRGALSQALTAAAERLTSAGLSDNRIDSLSLLGRIAHLGDWAADERARAEKAEAALAERDRQVREAIQKLREQQEDADWIGKHLQEDGDHDFARNVAKRNEGRKEVLDRIEAARPLGTGGGEQVSGVGIGDRVILAAAKGRDPSALGTVIDGDPYEDRRAVVEVLHEDGSRRWRRTDQLRRLGDHKGPSPDLAADLRDRLGEEAPAWTTPSEPREEKS